MKDFAGKNKKKKQRKNKSIFTLNRSSQRTISTKKLSKEISKKIEDQPLANDEKFHFLRRDQYFKSLHEIKIAKRKKALEQKSNT